MYVSGRSIIDVANLGAHWISTPFPASCCFDNRAIRMLCETRFEDYVDEI